jgi:hypothetical protein
MLKTLPVATFVAMISLSPAYAAGECTEAHMKQMDDMIAKMSDATKKKEATMHLDMSKADEEGQRSWVHGAHERSAQGDGDVRMSHRTWSPETASG